MKKAEDVQNCNIMNINDFDNKFIPKHIGNGIYVVEWFGLMCDENFIEELNDAIIEEVKKT